MQLIVATEARLFQLIAALQIIHVSFHKFLCCACPRQLSEHMTHMHYNGTQPAVKVCPERDTLVMHLFIATGG